MDKQSRKELRKEYEAQLAKVRKVLRKYAPIDPSDSYSDKDDYEHCCGEFVVMLSKNCEEADLFARLHQIRTQHWRLPANEARDQKIAAEVRRAFFTETTERSSQAPQPKVRKFALSDVMASVPETLRMLISKQGHGPEAVTMLVVGFEVDQSGWVLLWLDTRPNAYLDGEWTKHIAAFSLPIPEWIKLLASARAGRIRLIGSPTDSILIESDEELAEAIGQALTGIVQSLSERGSWNDLNLAPGCRLILEDYNGHFAAEISL